MDPRNLVCTNTTRFIIPMLFEDSNHINILDNNFVDSYSFDYYEPNHDNKIIIVRSDDELPRTTYKPIETYKRQNQYCFVYEIPDKFKKDYEYITKGEYEGVSLDYFRLFYNFWEDDFKFPTTNYNPIREIYRVTV